MSFGTNQPSNVYDQIAAGVVFEQLRERRLPVRFAYTLLSAIERAQDVALTQCPARSRGEDKAPVDPCASLRALCLNSKSTAERGSGSVALCRCPRDAGALCGLRGSVTQSVIREAILLRCAVAGGEVTDEIRRIAADLRK